jgi:dihydroneopterin aldolase
MSDRIILGGMSFLARHGVEPHEKEIEQRFEVDVELELDLRAAGLHDDLADTIDYGVIYRRCRRIVEGSPLDLVESLAERIADDLLSAYAVESVTVRVRKPDIDLGGPVEVIGIEIVRRRA